jgi:hypothetical protein
MDSNKSFKFISYILGGLVTNCEYSDPKNSSSIFFFFFFSFFVLSRRNNSQSRSNIYISVCNMQMHKLCLGCFHLQLVAYDFEQGNALLPRLRNIACHILVLLSGRQRSLSYERSRSVFYFIWSFNCVCSLLTLTHAPTHLTILSLGTQSPSTKVQAACALWIIPFLILWDEARKWYFIFLGHSLFPLFRSFI